MVLRCLLSIFTSDFFICFELYCFKCVLKRDIDIPLHLLKLCLLYTGMGADQTATDQVLSMGESKGRIRINTSFLIKFMVLCGGWSLLLCVVVILFVSLVESRFVRSTWCYVVTNISTCSHRYLMYLHIWRHRHFGRISLFHDIQSLIASEGEKRQIDNITVNPMLIR